MVGQLGKGELGDGGKREWQLEKGVKGRGS